MKLHRFAIMYDVPHGTVEIECKPGDQPHFHFRPNFQSGTTAPSHGGPITVNPTGTTDARQIGDLLDKSQIERSIESVEEMDRAACLVKALADNTAIADTAVSMQSNEYGGERFGPHHDLNASLASISRLYHKALEQDDGIQRVIGVVVNDEDDWRDDDDEWDDDDDE